MFSFEHTLLIWSHESSLSSVALIVTSTSKIYSLYFLTLSTISISIALDLTTTTSLILFSTCSLWSFLCSHLLYFMEFFIFLDIFLQFEFNFFKAQTQFSWIFKKEKELFLFLMDFFYVYCVPKISIFYLILEQIFFTKISLGYSSRFLIFFILFFFNFPWAFILSFFPPLSKNVCYTFWMKISTDQSDSFERSKI